MLCVPLASVPGSVYDAVPVLPEPAVTVTGEPRAVVPSKNWTVPVGLPSGLLVPPMLAGVMVSVNVMDVPTCCGEAGLAVTTEVVGSPMV